MRLDLKPHPSSRPAEVRSVTATIGRAPLGALILGYAVEPARSLLLADHGHERRDGLWRSTCFELFVRLKHGGYREFNFAPVSAWNAYAFTDWRTGMTPLRMQSAPHVVDSRLDDRSTSFPEHYGLDVVLQPEVLAQGDELSITAVIEETNGIRSYWALAHPPGAPNFHHPACFTMELPPTL
jgi:hypothetical protein